MSASRCCRNCSNPRLAVMFALSALWAITPSGPALAAASSPAVVGEHIQHIRGALLPAVLIQGEHDRATTLSDRMASLRVPGVSIAVIHDGKLEWARGFGVSKIGGPAVTPNTLFQAASISTPVTALGVLHLVEMGKLDLDVDVNQYLKAWKIPANAFTDQKSVTLRELLAHTAGMTVHGFLGYAGDAPLPNMKQILDGLPPANSPAIRVDVVPGSIWRYSGGGYVVVQQAVIDVSGEPFPAYMHSRVLEPLGMTSSTYEQPLPADRRPAAASGYFPGMQPVPGKWHI